MGITIGGLSKGREPVLTEGSDSHVEIFSGTGMWCTTRMCQRFRSQILAMLAIEGDEPYPLGKYRLVHVHL